MAADPQLWILSRGRKGDLDQMLVLAKALGWPFEVKTLSFAGPEIPVLSQLLLRNMPPPPWPGLVLCAEASPSVIAREIKRRSGGRTKIVCLGRPSGSAEGFDLVITTAQYRIPPADNVVELSMPLSGGMSATAGERPQGPIAFIIGGPAFPDILDAAAAERLAVDALAYAARKELLLSVQTSPRTPPAAVAVLQRRIMPPHVLGVFGKGENRYRAVLEEASEIVVTSDSVSMVSDALATGKPVSIYPLAQAQTLKWRAGNWLYAHAVERPAPLLSPARWLFDSGVIEVAPDRRKLFSRLAAERRVSWFGEPPAEADPHAAQRDLARAAQSLRQLMTKEKD